MTEDSYHNKKDYLGDLGELMNQISADYDFGDVLSYKRIEIGYEDNNYELETAKGKYLVKIFGSYRDTGSCERYVEILEHVDAAGVRMPKLYKYNNSALYSHNGANLTVFEFINGKSFYQLGASPTEEDAEEILHQAAKINLIDYKPEFVYDDWAIINILKEYKKTEGFLKENVLKVIEPLINEFSEVDLDALPHAFVHGDLITTNVMRAADGKIFFLDFACANWCPRIIELAILSGNLLRNFDLGWIAENYGKYNLLTDQEKVLLPLFRKMTYVICAVSAIRERDLYGNNSKENEYWLNQGLTGLGIKEEM